MSDLTVLTVVENDRGILDLLIRSIYKFTDPIPKIIICDQGGNGNVMSKYSNDPNCTVIVNSPKLAGGSSSRSGATVENQDGPELRRSDDEGLPSHQVDRSGRRP